MALGYASWVSETGTLTGTDPTYTLPNVASTASGNQFLRTLGAAFTTASDVVLTISNSSGAETSIWTFTPGTSGAAGTIERVQLIESSTGAAINWSAQTVTIGLDIPAPAGTSAGTTSEGRIPFYGSNGNLDLSGLPPFGRGKFVRGLWYGGVSGDYIGQAPTGGYLQLIPMSMAGPITPQAIGMYVTTAPTADTAFQLGVYADNGGNPSGGALLLDAGLLTVKSGTTGAQTIALSGVTIDPGDAPIVWIGLIVPATTNNIQIACQGNGSGNYTFAQKIGLVNLANGGSNTFGSSQFQSAAVGPLANPCPNTFEYTSPVPSVELQA